MIDYSTLHLDINTKLKANTVLSEDIY